VLVLVASQVSVLVKLMLVYLMVVLPLPVREVTTITVLPVSIPLTSHCTTADQAIEVTFYWPTILPHETQSCSFAHVLGVGDLTLAIQTANTIFTLDSIQLDGCADTICPGDYIDIRLSGDSSIIWNWGPAYNISDLVGSMVTVNPEQLLLVLCYSYSSFLRFIRCNHQELHSVCRYFSACLYRTG
jgi:hypothetical protein